MSDLRPKYTRITLGEEEFDLLFSVNVIDDIQDHFDISIIKLSDVLKDERKTYKVLRYLLAALINEALEDTESDRARVTPQWVGRKLTPANLHLLKNTALCSISNGTPISEDDDTPNAVSE